MLTNFKKKAGKKNIDSKRKTFCESDIHQLGKYVLIILMSSSGRSCVFVSTMPMRFSTAIPWQTLPKMQCFPSNHCVGPSVRKNWLPLVSGPAFAMARIPAPKQQFKKEKKKQNTCTKLNEMVIDAPIIHSYHFHLDTWL